NDQRFRKDVPKKSRFVQNRGRSPPHGRVYIRKGWRTMAEGNRGGENMAKGGGNAGRGGYALHSWPPLVVLGVTGRRFPADRTRSRSARQGGRAGGAWR